MQIVAPFSNKKFQTSLVNSAIIFDRVKDCNPSNHRLSCDGRGSRWELDMQQLAFSLLIDFLVPSISDPFVLLILL